ncbi:hypothetical protein LAZ67_9000140, partial [Cordylochernes scorpioides]
MAEEIILRLKKKRAVNRSYLTKTCNKIESGLDTLMRIEIEELLEQLNESFNELKLVDHEIETLLETDDLEKELQGVEEYREKYITWRFRANKKIRQSDFHGENIPNSNSRIDENEMRHYVPSCTTVKLPKLMISKFYGNFSEWLTFWNSFDAAIHQNNSLNPIDKFNYLKSHLGGTALNTVEGFALSADNYEKAIKLLKDRFGREDILISRHMNNLLSMRPLKTSNDVRTFRELFDNLSVHIRSLESLNVSIDVYGQLLCPIIINLLPADLNLELNKELPTGYVINDLITFLERQLTAREKSFRNEIGTGNESTSKPNLVNKHPKTRFYNEKPIATASELLNSVHKSNECVFCGKDNHGSPKCDFAANISLNEKRSLMKKKGVCYKCLRPSHLSKFCRNVVRCSICNMSSHLDVMCTKLILDRGGSSKSPTVQDETLANLSTSPDVLLPTLRVTLKGNRTEKTARAIIDTGSQRSYILHSTAMEMEYEQSRREFFRHSLFGGSSTDVVEHEVYTIHLSDINNSYRCGFEALGQPLICGSIPPVCPRSLLEGSEELDVSDLMRDRIEVLIGADIAGRLLTDDQRRISSGLVAIRTKLGWTVMGKIPPTEVRDDISSLCVTTLLSLDLENLWKLDAIGVSDAEVEKKTQSLQAEMEEHFAHTTTRDIEGRYEVALPWVQDKERIPSNKDLAENQLRSVRRKLEEVGDMKEYGQIFEEWMKQGIIEYAREDKLDGVHYLPHRPVYKRNSQTSRIWPVFNASARKRGKLSLNDCLDKGPNLIEIIPRLLNKFRKYEVGVSSDIEKAFLQIGIKEEDRDYLRFLWHTEDGRLITYRHKRVVFGITTSPYLLKATLSLHLDKAPEHLKITAEQLKSSFYVDNCLSSFQNVEETEKFVKESTELLSTACFNLRDWVSNVTDFSLMNQLNKEVNILGITWNTDRDTLTIGLEDFELIGPTTKRKVLSIASKIFDPLGVACPVTLIPKLILQETWIQKLTWDEVLPGCLVQRFWKWFSKLKHLPNIEIPRWLCFKDSYVEKTTLHIFCDASQFAYATCIFLRIEKEDRVDIQLIQARTRVAPLKKLTIPRLELLACLIGARLAANVIQDLEFEEIPRFYWTDSTNALCWIQREDNWAAFVMNREIKDLESENKAIVESKNIHGLKLFQQEVNERKISLNQVINTLLESELDDTQYDDYSKAKKDIFNMLVSIEEALSLIETKENTHSDKQLPESNVNLPKINLPIFNGDSANWLSFREIFNSTINSNQTLTEIQKFQYLNASVKGPAEKLIRGFPISDKNYQQAWDTLCNRFNNRRELAFSQINKIFSIRPLKSISAGSLYEILDVCNEGIRNLSVLGLEKNTLTDLILINFFEKRIGEALRKEWELTLQNEEYPTFENFVNFLEKHARSLQGMRIPLFQEQKTSSKNMMAHGLYVNKGQNCILCHQIHKLNDCQRFINLPLPKKWELVKKHKLCQNCLRANHEISKCLITSRCKNCKQNHHTLLHEYNSEPSIPQPTTSQEMLISTNTICNAMPLETETNILLSSALIKVKAKDGSFVLCRALVDNGSQISLISEQCCHKLGLEKRKNSYTLKGVGDIVVNRTTSQVEIEFTPHHNDQLFSARAFVVGRVTADLPNFQIQSADFPHLENLLLADPEFYVTKPIDLILGADTFVEIILGHKTDLKHHPIALNTKLGWLVSGRIHSTIKSNTSVINHCTTELDSSIRKFWELEDVPISKAQLGIKNAPSPSLPGSIQTSPSLPDSVQGSPSLTLSLQSSKHNSPTPLQVSVHSLKEAMSPLVEMPSSPGCSKQIPIPIEEDSIESQNRVDNLPSYPMSPEQSYTLSSASVEDFKAQSGPKSPTSPTRGSESCRCSGDYTEPQMSQNSNFSCSSIEESEDNSSKSEENLSRSEDNPSKSEEIPSKSKKSRISKLTPQITSKQNQLLPSESSQPSTPEQPLASQSSEPLSSKKETSIIPKIKPPPYYRRKRQLPAEKTSWDEPIESDIKSNWNKFQTQLSCLKEIKIPRYLNSSSSEIEELQLHGFCDASLNAYSAVFYLKTRFKIQKIKINLITSKTKVAPLKTITIPRLELSAALLLAQLNQVILESFPFQPDKTFLWTDSQICIDWIRSDASRWKAFVSNRVSSIQNLTQITDWFHVSSQDNPADCASRGIMPQDLVNHRIWWRGPIWLQENNVRYIPSSPTQVNLNIIQEEVGEGQVLDQTTLIQNSETMLNLEFIERYSTMTKLIRITAWCWRFYYNCLLFDPIRQKGPLTTRELTKAIQVLVKSIQQVEFCTEIKLLKSNKQLPLSNKLTSLNPFLDTQGLLRVGGRLKYSYLNENQNFPLLLPKNHHITNLIIDDIHRKYLHAGPQLVLSILRKNYWILGARDAVKKTIKKCLICLKFKSTTIHQIMGNLPPERIIPSRPFSKTGIDLTGPFSIKRSLGRSKTISKSYIVLFICFTTKAIHLELTTSLSTDSFMASLRRFMARRGKPSDIYSDNATNFKGASNFFRTQFQLLNSQSVQRLVTEELITWHFIPPGGPHFGGLWEAGIKSVKSHLVRTFKSTTLNYEEMNTLIIQIESCLNSRPLAPLSSDPNDYEALTPAHFLIGSSFSEIPTSNSEVLNLQTRWKLIQNLKNSFWSRWSKEYLSNLQGRGKWRIKQDNIQIGQLVYLKEAQISPLRWPLARIQELFPGEDKNVRPRTKKIDFSRLKCDPTLKNITWKFIPPGAPWWGGWWERLIGMMKQLLFRILGQTSLGYEELSTVMCDVESLMNTRPLTYLTEESEDLAPLTPSLFLHEVREVGVPDLDLIDNQTLSRKYQYIKRVREDLRERFRIEYFGFLRQETRGLKTTIPFKVGDMVLIGQESLKRLHWPLARIIQLYPGKDRLVRVAKVKTSSGDKIRPIQKLYNLEITPEIRCRDPLTERSPTQEVRLTTEEDPLTSQQEQHHIDTPNVVSSYGRPIKRPNRLDLLNFSFPCLSRRDANSK